MTVQETLAGTVAACKGLSTRFLPGFTNANRTAQATHLPNHLMWTLGHVSYFLHVTAGRVDGKPVPEKDFGSDTGRRASRYCVASIGFDSKPVDDPKGYPSLARGLAIFESACDRLAAAAKKADNAKLARKVDWLGMKAPLAQIIARSVFHVGVHTGQLLDLRRALGLERVLKL